MLSIKQLSKSYVVGKDTPNVVALDNINLELPSSGLVMIVGTSGCGKTTLLNILGGIDKPTSGAVEIDGQSVDYSDNNALDLYRCHTVSFVFQDYNLLYDYTVLDNVKLGMQLQDKDKKEIESKAEEALKAVGLYDMRDRKIATLSGGQQQRIAIARAIAKDSKFVLCDEPTGNLDSTNSEEIFQVLKKLSGDRLFVIVTHNDEAANTYADRIVRLQDGKVLEDKVINAKALVQKDSNTQTQETENVDVDKPAKKAHKQKKRANGLSFRNMMLMIKDNIVNSLLSNITMLVALLVTFTLVTSFLSMSAYNSSSAYVNTLHSNNQYVMPLLKYVDQRVEIPNEGDGDNNTEGADMSYNNDESDVTVSYGPQPNYEGAKYEDIATLQQKMGKANYYPSYFFNKNLQDFTDSFIINDNKQFQYVAYGFREAVAVENFSTFHQPLSYGKLPTADNEILIYDYMAYSMIEHKMFSGEIKDIVGKTLTDVNTGLTLTISGLLKSDYQRYEYVKEGLADYSFEESYLTSLQTIYCYPEVITKLQAERTYTPVMHAELVVKDNSGVTTTTVKLDTKKLNYIDIDGLTFVAQNENINNMRGIIMSKAQVAQILKIDQSAVTKEVAEDFMATYRLEALVSLYDYSLDRNYAYLDGYSVIGVCNEEVAEEGVIALSTHSDEDLNMSNGTFRQIYLSLGTNWTENAEVIEYFAVIYQTQEYYEANPDYYLEAYTTNSPYAVLVDEADVYMYKVKNFSSYIMYILIVLTVVFIVIYTHINLKKFDYKIGVLKALGANTWNIILVFGLQLLAISVIGYLLSVPIAALVMSRINVSFVGNSAASLVLFALDGVSVVVTLAIATVGVAIVTLLPLLKLAFASPITVIRGSRDDQ